MGIDSQVNIQEGQSALVVVDMLNDFVSNGGFFDKELGVDTTPIQEIIPRVVGLIKDYKKHDIPVIFVAAVYNLEYLFPPVRSKFEEMGISELALKGSWGGNFISQLPSPDFIVAKSHYSPFSNCSLLFRAGAGAHVEDYLEWPVDKDEEVINKGGQDLLGLYKQAHQRARRDIQAPPEVAREHLEEGRTTTLEAFLESLNRDTLLVTGASTHVCVDRTVAGASERGYEVVVVHDAVASEDPARHDVYLQTFDQFEAKVVYEEELFFSKV